MKEKNRIEELGMRLKFLSGRIARVVTIALVIIAIDGCKHTGEQVIPKEKPAADENDETFSIAIIPDTQYYTSLKHNGTMSMFEQQIQWIRDNKTKEKIAYVIHLGDLVDTGSDQAQWIRGKTEMYKLETDHIPYGIAVGNHDQSPNGDPTFPSTELGYNLYFGRTHMSAFPWFGGAEGSSNNADNHYDLFTANGVDYLVLYVEFNSPGAAEYNPALEATTMNWVNGVLTTYANRKIIVVSHSILNVPSESNSPTIPGQGNNNIEGQFTVQGKIIYANMKLHKNVFLMLSGHISGEGFRKDEFDGGVIKTYLADYQSRENAPYNGTKRNGGNGLMRLMRFNKTKQTLSVRTFAPQKDGTLIEERDSDSEFTKPLYN
ncbi:metallophosphoesterase [Pedobacter sp. Du54]|uniref:metallophosphoesterase n=1 Tax=Pedobacter anseongensis TaxID=3133439 RepID=UPI0030A82697